MKVNNIFTIIDESLYSVMYEGEIEHEFRRIFNNWNDPEYLEAFFEEHKADLQSGFRGNITIDKAVSLTRIFAKNLEKKILKTAEAGKKDREEALSTLFRPLHDTTIEMEDFEMNKVRGTEDKSWLRIYAIRIELNLFVVSGGAIKLTRTMQEREHTNLELNKLDITQKYLQDQENDHGF